MSIASVSLVLNVTPSGIRASLRLTASSVPARGEIELEIDRQSLAGGRHAEAHGDLAVRDLARRTSVLALHPDRVFSLLEHARVVDDPAADRFARGHLANGIPRSRATDLAIAPRGIDEEVVNPLVGGVDTVGVWAGTSRDRLHTLSLPVAQKALGVQGERGSPLLVIEDLADGVEVFREAALARLVEEFHDH